MSLLNPNLEAFLAICEAKTVHAAAAKIHLTRTGVTQRIRSLESGLGVTLFIRTRKGMLLTKEGDQLYRYCLRAKQLESETMANLRGLENANQIVLSITGPTSLMNSRIIPSILQYAKFYPKMLFNFKIQDEHEWISDLKKGKTDIAIVPSNFVPKEFENKPLKPERYVLVGPHKWHKKDLKNILSSYPIIDFDETDLTSFNYLKKFNLINLTNKLRHFVNNNESLVQMIELGLGYGVLTEEIANSFLKNKKIVLLNEGKYLENKLSAVWYRRTEPFKYWTALLDSIN
ncbi:MAG: LysR family transcriptional regulator [Bacteriovoracaceae bacterium]|nr:LysR family transcriptional regulator [Bacteriovoracaceae bacterium]